MEQLINAQMSTQRAHAGMNIKPQVQRAPISLWQIGGHLTEGQLECSWDLCEISHMNPTWAA